MKAFLAAAVTMIVITVLAPVTLDRLGPSSAQAEASSAVRLD